MKWHSEGFMANKAWVNKIKVFNKLFPDYPFKPPSRTAWEDECRKYGQAMRGLHDRKRASRREWQRASKDCEIQPFDQTVFPRYRGRNPRGSVLCGETIWFPMEWHPELSPLASWPPAEQQKYEGDDRVNSKSGRSFGRFLALPRYTSDNPTVTWTMWKVVPQCIFDEVWPVPTGSDVYAPVDEIEEEKIPELINLELLDVIEQAGKSDC